MPSPKRAVISALAAVAIAGCGSTAKPIAGTSGKTVQQRLHGRVDNPLTTHLTCMEKDHLPVTTVGTTGLQVGALPGGPTIEFQPTPGAAQEAQISGQPRYQGAEVIGAALLYPNRASDAELQEVEACLALGVTG